MTSRILQYALACATLLQVLPTAFAQQRSQVSTIISGSSQNVPNLQQARQVLDKQGPVYIENRGQWDPRAKFLLKGGGLDMWITDRGMVYDLYRLKKDQSKTTETYSLLSSRAQNSQLEPTTRSGQVVAISFKDALFTTAVRGTGKQPGCYNYFIGSDESKWATNVPLYSGARIEKLYDGIDVVFYLDGGRPRYDLIVAAQGDPAQVQMKIEGSDGVSIGADGSLLIETSTGVLQQRGLYAYQEVKGVRQQVACRFVVDGKQGVRFAVGNYDRTRPLVIDPLIYSTFIGGSANDQPNGIAVDAAGNAYIVGATASSGFPTTAGAYDGSYNSPTYNDVFVTKLNPAGTALVYSTFIGGDRGDEGNDIVIDGSGNAYITGTTGQFAVTGYPTTAGALRTTYGGSDSDGFLTKLNVTGSLLLYSTYIGAGAEQVCMGVAMDGSGDAYVIGITQPPAAGFPVTVGAFDVSHNGGDDIFVVKIRPAGLGLSDLVYGTYIGGGPSEVAGDIAVDASGNAFITGSTGTIPPHYPFTAGAFDITPNGNSEVVVTKLNSTGSALLYSTVLGGVAFDQGNDIAIDATGNAYVTGTTTDAASTDFPTTTGAFDEGHNGGTDVFVTKLNPAGSALVYSTFIGGAAADAGNGIVVDASGIAYVAGNAGSIAYPTTTGAFDEGHNGGTDVIVTKLNAAGSALIYSTYVGGTGNDAGRGIARDGFGGVYITGNTNHASFPTAPGAYDAGINGAIDGVVFKLDIGQVDAILPVELAGFSLSASNSTVNISWRTASEINNTGFEVQRSIDGNTNFTPIASYLTHSELVGLGTNSTGRKYALVDAYVSPGLYHYRLVDVSTDGVRTAHPAKSIRIEMEAGQVTDRTLLQLNTVMPNPVNTEMQVSYTVPDAMAVTMEIFSLDGRLVSVPLDAELRQAGSHSQSILVDGLQPGIYTLRLVAGGSSRVQQFVVVR